MDSYNIQILFVLILIMCTGIKSAEGTTLPDRSMTMNDFRTELIHIFKDLGERKGKFEHKVNEYTKKIEDILELADKDVAQNKVDMRELIKYLEPLPLSKFVHQAIADQPFNQTVSKDWVSSTSTNQHMVIKRLEATKPTQTRLTQAIISSFIANLQYNSPLFVRYYGYIEHGNFLYVITEYVLTDMHTFKYCALPTIKRNEDMHCTRINHLFATFKDTSIESFYMMYYKFYQPTLNNTEIQTYTLELMNDILQKLQIYDIHKFPALENHLLFKILPNTSRTFTLPQFGNFESKDLQVHNSSNWFLKNERETAGLKMKEERKRLSKNALENTYKIDDDVENISKASTSEQVTNIKDKATLIEKEIIDTKRRIKSKNKKCQINKPEKQKSSNRYSEKNEQDLKKIKAQQNNDKNISNLHYKIINLPTYLFAWMYCLWNSIFSTKTDDRLQGPNLKNLTPNKKEKDKKFTSQVKWVYFIAKIVWSVAILVWLYVVYIWFYYNLDFMMMTKKEINIWLNYFNILFQKIESLYIYHKIRDKE